MSLQAKCARCQGIFSNFRQTVERNGATYCVQCADAIANGASPAMYGHQLIAHNIFQDPQSQIDMEDEAVRANPSALGARPLDA